ncbi:MAG TPA: NAD(P)H-binding protein [Anaerolineales bacterium]
MILVTGGTGFVGKALIRHLAEEGRPVRILIRPSPRSPDLPRGLPVEVAVSGLMDERGLRAAMVGVDTVYHLASSERRGAQANLMDSDIQGTRSVVRAAQDANVKRIFFVSHLGADRASAFPVLKVKAIAEEAIRRSGLDYTILRSAIIFGPGDRLTTGLARILAVSPQFFLVPGSGNSPLNQFRQLLQPLWVEDLVTCLTWALEDPETRNRTIEIGGPEYLNIDQIAEQVMGAMGIHRQLFHVSPLFLRWFTIFLEWAFPRLPVDVFWLDYLAVSRTCALDTAPRVFNLMPSRLSQRLAYLTTQNWRVSLMRTLLQR